jgi:predicted phosphodiesterase
MAFEASPLDPYASAIQLWLNQYLTNDEIVQALKAEFGVETSEASVRRAIARHELDKPQRQSAQDRAERPGVEFNDKNEATVTSGVMGQDELSDLQLGDIEILLRNRNLNPDDWIVERVTVNEWDGNTGRPAPGEDAKIVTFKQLKIHLKRRQALDFIMPAVDVQPRPKSSKKFKFDSSFLAAVLGDEQEPYADRVAEDKVYQWLEHNQPQVIVHLGDLMDLPTISRHKDNPEWSASVQECLNAGYERLSNYVSICPDAHFVFMLGNHDERLRNELLLRAERMYGIRPADRPGQPQAVDALSPRNLLHLDELGIEFIDPKGGYAHAQYNLSSQLGVRHGWLTGDNTASKSLDRLGHSIIVGHTHAQRITYKTVYNIDGVANVLQGIETGTLSQIESGIGYTVAPNWQHGFAGVQVWEDGSFHADLATLAGGTLRWRDQRF